MNAIPGGLRTDQQPPMAIPLRHFVVALGFLLAGAVGWTAASLTVLPAQAGIARIHALLVGWICLTIMGAMTQFVPVWSGVTIHSRRLAVAQLWLVVAGLLGFLALLLADALEALPIAAALLLLGIWCFVYNVGRTLLRARPLDVTERHFAYALGFFATLAPLGYLLALDIAVPAFDSLPVTRTDVVSVHATLAVFGAVLTTVSGAIYQLGKMFTQASLSPADRALQRLEEGLLPAGVVVLALGRGIGAPTVARVGAIAVLVGAFALGTVVASLLWRASTDSSPMTDRYWLAVAALFAWGGLAAPAWWTDPTGYGTLVGAPGSITLLVLGVFGFVVVGTVYHVVPFIVWLETYSDRIGLERVPTIDELYDDRLERVDLVATAVGVLGLSIAGFVDVPTAFVAGSGVLATVGFALFAANAALTIRRHAPGGLVGVFRSGSESDGGSRSDEGEDGAHPGD